MTYDEIKAAAEAIEARKPVRPVPLIIASQEMRDYHAASSHWLAEKAELARQAVPDVAASGVDNYRASLLLDHYLITEAPGFDPFAA